MSVTTPEVVVMDEIPEAPATPERPWPIESICADTRNLVEMFEEIRRENRQWKNWKQVAE